MLAADIMTTPVITASAEANVREVARLLLEHGIGAVPVVDDSGVVIGMASDGDLLGRRPDDQRRDWWLEALADGRPSDEFAASMSRPARDVMSVPLIMVAPDTPVGEIAALMRAHRIKRLPVVRGGALVGIVTRADLLAAVERLAPATHPKGEAAAGFMNFLESLAGGAHIFGSGERGGAAPSASPAEPKPPTPASAPSAETFREDVRAFEQGASNRVSGEQEARRLERQRVTKLVLDDHLTDERWRQLLAQAETAAQRGEKEFLLDRFPCEVCTDGGRMIDVAEEGWETSLRGRPAELIGRWRDELRPKGFGLSARIVSYVDGVLGDVGLFLTWGG
ncbi:MAG: CBS domain-containing protein [Hyphomicrobiales bacterium]|nr:CBS domain-containing protein [Hyphomicrobiales bacterium]MBV8661614.1 CBS domain-containing protein [Hyphomicrobiales bacterium]